jgi:hypothetical protein
VFWATRKGKEQQVWWARTTVFWAVLEQAIEGYHNQPNNREKGLCEGAIGLVLSCRDSGGFGGAVDALTLNLSSTSKETRGFIISE